MNTQSQQQQQYFNWAEYGGEIIISCEKKIDREGQLEKNKLYRRAQKIAKLMEQPTKNSTNELH